MLENKKLIYITPLNFRTCFANQIQVLSMAQAFSQLLGNGFILVCSGEENENLSKIPHHIVNPPFFKRFFSIYYYFLWMPFLLISNRSTVSQTILYFKDTRLATYALIWKKLFSSNIRIVMEAHVPFPLDRYVFPRVDLIVTITKAMVEIIKNQYYISPQKISLLPDGVDLKKFDLNTNHLEARKITNLPLNKKIILYSGSVGFYKDWKGEDVFIKAAKFFTNDFIFVVVGGNSSDAEKSTGEFLPENVLCVGRQPHASIPLYLKAADILILPNKKGNQISEKLTSPLKLFEYMASNTPIIASNLPSIREVLNDANALLVEPNNPKILADGIAKLIQDKKLASSLAKQAIIDVKSYEWRNRARQVLDIFNKNLLRNEHYFNQEN